MIELEDERPASSAAPGLMQQGSNPNRYLSESEVHNLIAMLQAGDSDYVMEVLKSMIPNVSVSSNLRYISTDNFEILQWLHANQAAVTAEQIDQLTAPVATPVTPLDFGYSQTDITSLTERHSPSEALRIVVDAAARFRATSASQSSSASPKPMLATTKAKALPPRPSRAEDCDSSEDSPDKPPSPDTDKPTYDPPDDQTPETLLETNEQTGQISRAVQNLAESQRVAFTLFYQEELSYQDIADVLQTSVSAVESLLFRARQTLRKKLSKP